MSRVAIVSGRGYGKTLLMANLANPEAPTVEELANATPLEGVTDIGFSFAPGDDVTVYPASNYTAQISFHSEVLGRWWEYTPAEELRDRLNHRLQGKPPAIVSNTRYWRGL